jgi:curved DNA-binding protein CbpA
VNPRRVLGVADHATSLEILAAYEFLASREAPGKGGYSQRIARLAEARDALLGADGL